MVISALTSCRVEVAYARADEQCLIALDAPPGASAAAMIELSGMLERYPEIDLACHQIGIFGKAVRLDYQVRDGDRIEIYRPLKINPKEQRRRRADAAG